MDVTSTFLNGVLKEEVYVEQPLGYMKICDEKKVLKLRKVVYELKQTPRAWNERIDGYFKKNGYEGYLICTSMPCTQRNQKMI